MIDRIGDDNVGPATPDERQEGDAFSILHNALQFHLANGPFYHDDSPHNDRPIRDNFSDDGPTAEPLPEEETLLKFGVHLWSTVDWRQDVHAQTAAGLRRMAAFLNEKAADVESKVDRR